MKPNWVLHRLDVRDGWILGLIVLAFVASRLTWLAWNLDSSLYWEESYRWVAALELRSGPSQPLLDYQADHYQGGSLVMILMTLLLFRLFGESILVMKLGAILFSSATLCLLYLLGRRVFGRAAGVTAALAYLAGPPLVAYWGVAVMGSHGESVLFSLLQLLVFFEILSGRWRTPFGWAAFGFVSGVGLWFCYTSGFSLAACGIAWLILEGFPSARELASAVAGTLLGLVPWFAYNVTHEFLGLGRVVELFGYGDPIDAWVPQSRLEKLVSLFRKDLPVGLLFPYENPWPGPVTVIVTAAFAIPLALALAFALRRALGGFLRSPRASGSLDGQAGGERCPADLVFVVYGVLFLAFFLGSRFTIDPGLGAVTYRMLLAPAVLLMIPAAATVGEGLQPARANRWVRWVTLGACGLYLAASASATILLASRTAEPLAENWRSLGHSTWGVLLHRKYEKDLGHALAAARRINDPKLHFNTLQGIGWGMEYRFETTEDLDQARRDLASIPPAERFAALSGLRYHAKDRLRKVGASLVRSDAGPGAGGLPLMRRLSRLEQYADGAWGRVPPRYHLRDQVPEPDEITQEYLVRGGQLYRTFEWDLERVLAETRLEDDPRLRFKLLQGIGWEMESRFETDGDLERIRQGIDSIPLGEGFAVLSGLRFRATQRLREVKESSTGGDAGDQSSILAERLARLTRYADSAWDRIPLQYQLRDRVEDAGTSAGATKPPDGRN